jgi:hypothetical protein
MKSNENDNDKFESITIIRLLIDLQKVSVLSNLSVLKEFANDTDKVIKSNKTEFDNRLNEKIKKYPQHEQEIKVHFEDQYSQYYEMYPALYKNSTLLTLYSFLEYNLDQICNNISDYKHNSKRKNNKLQVNTINVSKVFLTEKFKIDLSSVENEWSLLNNVYREIRNAIAHNNPTMITEEGKEIIEQPRYKSLKDNGYLANGYIKVNEQNGNFQIINNQFLVDFCSLIEKYLTEIFKRIFTKLQIIESMNEDCTT